MRLLSTASGLKPARLLPDSKGPLLRLRMEEHYHNTLMEDLMVLCYDHSDANRFQQDLRFDARAELQKVYLADLARIETQPCSSDIPASLLSVQHSRPPLMKRRYRKRLYNPIDYTAVPFSVLHAKPSPKPAEAFEPTARRLPQVSRVVLKTWTESALGNKAILLSAIMALQSIGGVKPEPLFAEKGDAVKRIREGMPLGCRVELTGHRMHEFMDKMVHCVLPRIREFKGFNPKGNGKGSISLTLPSSSVGYFPDIEPHFDMFPRLFDVDVLIQTTAQTDREMLLLLSGLQVPFKPTVDPVDDSDANVQQMSVWDKIKSAASREERIALHKAEIDAKRAAKKK